MTELSRTLQKSASFLRSDCGIGRSQRTSRISGEMPMEWAYELVSQKDSRVAGILDSIRTIVVPIVNVDGFNLSREAEVDLRALAETGPALKPATDQAGVDGYTAAILFDQTAGFFAYKRRNCRVKDGAVPADGDEGTDGRRYVGRVGSGFGDKALRDLQKRLDALARKTPPVEVPRTDAKDAHWVRPTLVGEVTFTEETPDGRLRHPVWKGLRPDKSPDDLRS